MRWSTLPVSVAAHCALFVALLFLPGALELPAPWPVSGTQAFVPAAVAAPPLPAEAPPTSARPSRGAPTSAAIGITDEPVHHPPSGPVVEGGLPPGLVGSAAGIPDGLIVPPRLPQPPPHPPAAPSFVRPGGEIREPKKIVHVPPGYPVIVRAARVEGYVIVEATIDERGVVTGARILRSVPLLDGAALAAIGQWRYSRPC